MEYVKNGRQGDYIQSDKKGRPTEPKVLIIPEQVRVRKHEVDIEGLQHCLLNALANSNKTKKQVAEELDDKFSTVEHYFRKVGSEFFCIPSEHHWFDLKTILNIETDEFDASITEFEIRDGRYDMADRVYNPEYKAPTVIASSVAKVLCHSLKEVRTEEAKKLRKEHREKTGEDHTPFRAKKLVPREDGKVGTLTPSLNKTHKVLIVPEATKKGYTEIQDGDCFDATFINSKTRRGRNMKDKSNCLTAANYDYMRYEHPTYRKLTPIECERLQTLPDNYTEGVSNTQRYKALGNGWTVDVIVHILQGLKQQKMAVAL
jgi:site-specific DNA-cytosine methylase